ncbi:EDD domain protein, DegV family [Pelagirhabdus alkalitolerans]|uniref:EDD domain protein, DegV family n=1 Tax=Pelagirhabdus alkalitolerans TaxID=1612202 RepID=A0A1G6MCA4_9BACI|nr:DegV family protein [Pelagirhabdus alkalitolerans]SDC53143.1 EDD domain protein, DegV family [Pelagirhabdus alkalitolerans]
MKKIAWITDSTCGLSQEFIDEHNIHVLPMIVNINNISYREDIDISKAEVYELLKSYGEGAKTSQPPYGEFVQLYEKLKEEYDVGIALHASSALTGTYQSSISASEMHEFPVEVIDSKIGSYALGKMIKNGIELEKQGKSYEEIVSTLKTYPDQTEMFLLPQSLEQLKRSGRVSTTQTVFANLLNINLVLKFEDGKVVVDEKIRSKKKAVRHLFQKIEDAYKKGEIKELGIMHAGAIEQAHKWKEELSQAYDNLKVIVEPLVPVAGVHTGYGTLSVSWIKE